MTSNPTLAAGGDPLSVDQAAEMLAGRADAAAAGDAPSDDASSGDEAGVETDDQEADDGAAAAPISPPHAWDAEAQARFRELPPDVQALIAEREGERDRETQRVMQEAAEARQRADGEISEAEQMTQALDHLLPQAARTFAGKWEAVDWAAWAQADPQAAFQGRTQFEAEEAELHRLASAQAQAQAVTHRHFVAGEAARLKAVSPELADPKAGPARRQAVARFLVELGATNDQLAKLTAEEAALAYDALQWRRARDGLSADRGGETGDRRTVRPSAAQAPRTSQQRRASDALARLSKSGSIDDAVAYLKSRG